VPAPPTMGMRSTTRLDDQIEWCLGCPAHRTEPRRSQHLLELPWSGLSAENVRPLLRDGVGAAQRGRGSVVEPADRIDVVLDAIAREWLDQHDRAVIGHGVCSVPGGINRPAHIVQAIEEADQVIVVPRVAISLRDLKFHTVVDARIPGHISGRGNRFLMNVEPPEPACRIGLGTSGRSNGRDHTRHRPLVHLW
jgi:hypothetical protein